jgi:predicted amidohydrolase YtcJ
MELAGVSAATPDPEGGEIVRDEDGEPIGIFREDAEELFDEAYDLSRANRTPEEIRAEELRVIDLATGECLRKGITTFCDAGVSLDTVDLYRELALAGELSIRLWVMISDSNEIIEGRLPEYRLIGLGDNFLTVRAIKRVFDGALGSHGAWLLEPYDDMPSSTGLNTEPIDRMKATARLATEHGFQFCTHAIGDRANREILDIYQEALAAHPEGRNLRWRVEHCQHLDASDLPRFAELGVMAAMQGVHCTSDGPWVPRRIGDERARTGAYVWRDLIESGATIANGTDAPVEDVSPLECLFATVTRQLPDGSRFYPEQCMTRREALRSYTLNGAFAAFEENIKGSITPGKLADLVVLSHDILTVPDENFLDTQVLYTIVGGTIVYQAPI